MRLHQFAQKAFIFKEDRVLVAQKTSKDPHNPHCWEVPGGRMVFGEDVDAHICREVREETGLDIIPGQPFYIWQWIMSTGGSDADQVQVVAVARECEATGDEISTDGQEVDDYLGEATWIPINELLDLNLIPSLRPAAEAFVSRRRKGC
ncbi:NUDIX hydrolase [Micromonospora sp. NBC_01655]|uniref:NUDIX domain-containing protein n=1 Tax=Micromonospora sp. NBC_01655 TaxID=2975983 RepID=UPI00224D7C98|nr:NUDIX hydrolase [Micromonospora sp. NBC_01655]MCX4472015.1 NUDIX hydrolase [Micromonospora sp. NBC_01655]